MKQILTIVFIAFSINVFGQVNFKKQIDNIYNFHPHELSLEARQKKFPAMDSLFLMIKSDTTKFLPLLRQELKSNDHFPYFYYDCSHLLLIESKSHSDQEIGAEAFSKSNIKDLDPEVYITLLSILAHSNINITKAAVKILEDSTFHFFIPAHAMDFMQGYCLTYCLVPLDPNLYVDTLATIFTHAQSINAQQSIITTLWFAYSCKGDLLLKSIMTDKSVNKDVRNYAKKIMGYTNLNSDQKFYIERAGKEALDNLRTSALQRFSDEAIEELDMTTRVLRKNNKCH